MRIVVMGTGQSVGGLRTHLQGLLGFLVREGHETFAVVVADSVGGVSLPLGVKMVPSVPHRAVNLGQKFRKYCALLRCEAWIRRLKPDLFIATAPGRGYAQLARCARRNGAFTIWQEVSIPARRDPLHTEMARSVDAVAVQTPGMEEPFRRAIPEATNVGYLPCFFDAPKSTRIATLPIEGDTVLLAYFGRLAGNKGLVPFLDVFRDVSTRIPLRFDIHGEGEEKALLAKTIRENGLENLVNLRGRYPEGEEYGNLLASYHALVLPSIDCEGIPLVLLEAMSCGLPFLATNIGGISDIGAENPDVLLVEPAREALAAGLTQLVNSLATGQVSNRRLKAYYDERCSEQRVSATWRAMLAGRWKSFSNAEAIMT